MLAHELTHALQDQHVDLDKWSDQTPPDVSLDRSDDTVHLAKDEVDTAREAVTEGQATAVMMDNMLKPMGHSLLKDPEVVECAETADGRRGRFAGAGARTAAALRVAAVSLSRGSELRAGCMDGPGPESRPLRARSTGRQARLGRSSTRANTRKATCPPVPLLPDIHPLVDKLYKPYDIGQVGQLDVHILAGIFGGEAAARDFTPAWDGGIYWAGQLRNATAARAGHHGLDRAALSLRVEERCFRAGLRLALRARAGPQVFGPQARHGRSSTILDEQVFTTNEGPVVITTRGKLVFVSESFDLPLARKLATLILDAQGTGEMKFADLDRPLSAQPSALHQASFARNGIAAAPEPLTGSLVHFISDCGVMKVAVDAAYQSIR